MLTGCHSELVEAVGNNALPPVVRQRSVIEFFTTEGKMPIRIHERLKNVYGDATVGVSTVRRWFVSVKKLKDKQGWLKSVRQ